jgi:RNA polymerase sigma-70 factor (ECF subfamily)
MMLENLVIDSHSDNNVVSSYVVAKSQKIRVMRERRVSKNAAADPNWVACVIRIRDQKDRAAFAELFRHFAPRVKAFLMKSGSDAGLAEECAQEVMATLWNKAHLFDPSRASVATWVFTIARNKRIDMLRKQRRPEPEEITWGPEAEPNAADILELQQENNRLAEAIGALPEKQKELIDKAYFKDLSHNEIATETGLPLGTIKSRIRLALEKIRHEMK